MSTEASLVFPQSTVACEGCDTDVDVIWFCKNCPASLCTECKEEHSKQKFLRKHEVVERSGSVLISHGEWKIAQPCQKHKGKDISTYCNDCNVPCCVACMEENHQRHSFTSIEKKYMDTEARLNDFVKKVETKAIPVMEVDLSHLNELLESCEIDYDDAEKEVEKFRQKLRNSIDQSCDAVVKKLKQKQNESCSQLQNSIEDVQKQVNNAKKAVQKVETRIRKGGLDLIEYVPDPSLSKCQSLSKTSYMRPKFIPDENISRTLSSDIGEMKYETVTGEMKGEKMKHVLLSIPSVDTVTIRSFQAEIHGHSIQPVSNDTAWISCDYSESLYLYDVNGKVVKSITVKGSKAILDIAVKKTGDLIVTCCDDKVRHVSMKGKISVLIDTQPFYPQGVCLTDNEEIVVCMDGQGDKKHVAVYSADGRSEIRDIVIRDGNGKFMFSNPYRVVMNGECVTVLNVSSNIINVNQDGKVIWVYDGSQTTLSKTFYPLGMCKDRYSNILISDFNNHCVHCVNSEGKLLQIIITQDNGIKHPWGIGISRDTDKLWLGSRSARTIWIMSYKNQ